MILGLGPNKRTHLYLDEFIPGEIDWNELHDEVCRGIAYSKWQKIFVSSGVHEAWADKEISTYIKALEKHLTPQQIIVFKSFPRLEQKLKYLNALIPQPHPFWLIFLRENKMVEPTRIANKSVASDSHWTDDIQYFPKLKALIETMPFESFGRVIFFMTEANNQTVPHFDAGSLEQRLTKENDDFIWFTTKPNSKSVFVMDDTTLEKTYAEPDKKFVWFNEMDFHGTDPVPHFSFAIRIDGKFKPGVKEMLYAD